jgi:hypothetical protein
MKSPRLVARAIPALAINAFVHMPCLLTLVYSLECRPLPSSV